MKIVCLVEVTLELHKITLEIYESMVSRNRVTWGCRSMAWL